MDNSKKEGGIVQLVVVLGLITFICALLLGVINGVTADKITQNGIETRNAAMAEIIPDADFEDLGTALSAEDVAAAGVTLPAGRTAAQIDGVYKATKDGEEIGYCVQVEPKGFGGNLTMIVGINADGTVVGAKVTSHAETPGLGAKSQADPNWITQFAGQTADGQLKVAKDGGTINAITGATITSRAVTDGVNCGSICRYSGLRRKSQMKFSEQLKSGVILDNPVFMQTIGLCPTLATTTSLQNAIGMGAAATVVLICSNIVISAMRRIIPDKIRIAAFITIIATFVTMIDLSMQAFLPSLASSLGLFLPLIVVNCIILGRAEAYASKNKVLPSALDGVVMGLGFTFALVLMGFFRELLGAGTILSGYVNGVNGIAVPFFHSNPMVMMILPAGGFLMMGFILAAIQKIMARKEDK